ncbi:hypothetical protein IJF86_00985 [Candidatus Saccharibacteria bacterium]|nr:hypothetical protein [Candidatus Saccharibacteria bacterium]
MFGSTLKIWMLMLVASIILAIISGFINPFIKKFDKAILRAYDKHPSPQGKPEVISLGFRFVGAKYPVYAMLFGIATTIAFAIETLKDFNIILIFLYAFLFYSVDILFLIFLCFLFDTLKIHLLVKRYGKRYGILIDVSEQYP